MTAQENQIIEQLESRYIESITELRKAHRIIHNALQLMSQDQKNAWAKANSKAGLIEEGPTRANERMSVLNKAEVAL